jgi:hypothetical protein
VTSSRSPIRSFERWVVGLGMAVIAFILEKVVMRSVRRGETKPATDSEPAPTTFTSRGGDVDVE